MQKEGKRGRGEEGGGREGGRSMYTTKGFSS